MTEPIKPTAGSLPKAGEAIPAEPIKPSQVKLDIDEAFCCLRREFRMTDRLGPYFSEEQIDEAEDRVLSLLDEIARLKAREVELAAIVVKQDGTIANLRRWTEQLEADLRFADRDRDGPVGGF